MTFYFLLQLMRIKHWPKNFFVLAPVLFSGNLFNYSILKTAIFAFIVFSLASSSVYVLNDILDVESDRKHPVKRARPIASGHISMRLAVLLYVLLLTISLILGYLINIILLYIILVFILLNVLYSVKLKHIVILDVLVVAFGYVLRILAGTLPLQLHMSPWILGSTLTLTLMITLAKRYAELINHNVEEQRKVINYYDKDFLQALLVLSASLTITVYLLWCIEDPINVNNNALIFSSMFVFYGILRYLYLTIKIKSTENPVVMIFKDKSLMFNGFLWVIYLIALIYVGI